MLATPCVADDQIRLGDADRGFTYGGSAAARTQVADLVGRLVAGTADSDIARQLRDLGIGYLWVRGGSEEVQARIDNTPGLGSASGTPEGIIWELEPPASRATVRDPQGLVNLDPGPGATCPARCRPGPSRASCCSASPSTRAGGPSSPARRGSGRSWSPPTAGGNRPSGCRPGGGEVTVRLESPARWLLLAQGLLVLVAAVLAAPGVRHPEVRDPTKTARRAATLSEVS